jgi:hypothetical protein
MLIVVFALDDTASPSFGGAIEGRGGPLADQISGTVPEAIGAEAGKVIRSAIEPVDV